MIDVSDPNSPREIAVYEIPDFATGVCVSGVYAYVADSRDDWREDGFRVVDVSVPEKPHEVGSYSVTPDTLYADGDYAYVASNALLHIIDVSNPAQPSLIGLCSIPDGTQDDDIHVSGDYAYVAYTGRATGLCVVDVSDPYLPHESGLYSIKHNSWNDRIGVHADGDHAYVAVKNEGIYVLWHDKTSEIPSQKIPPSIANDKCDPPNGATNVDLGKYDGLTIVFTKPLLEAKLIDTNVNAPFMHTLSKDGITFVLKLLKYRLGDNSELRITLRVKDQDGNEAVAIYSITLKRDDIVIPRELPPWDVNKDGVVDMLDFELVAQHLGETVVSPSIPSPDVNGDGNVNILDVILVARHWGEAYPSSTASLHYLTNERMGKIKIPE